MPKGKPEALTTEALTDLREKLGLTQLDFLYLLGRNLMPAKKPETIDNIPLAYMVRLLDSEPDLASSILPRWPGFEDAYEAIAKVWDKEKYGRLSDRKFAIICGVSPWTYTKWSTGDTSPNQSTVRLFFFLCEVIKRKGREGLDLYLQEIDKDARSRGHAGGIRDLFKSPGKKKAKDQEEVSAQAQDS